MKKIFLVLVLFSGLINIASSMNINKSGIGNFQAAAFCTPAITGGTAIDLKKYFVSSNPLPVAVSTPQVFVMRGPSNATYKITWDGSNPLLAHTSYSGSGTGTATLTGTWTGTDGPGGGNFSDNYNSSTGIYDPQNRSNNIDCTGSNKVVTLTFTPQTILPMSQGSVTFMINVYVQATI